MENSIKKYTVCGWSQWGYPWEHNEKHENSLFGLRVRPGSWLYVPNVGWWYEKLWRDVGLVFKQTTTSPMGEELDYEFKTEEDCDIAQKIFREGQNM